MRMTWMTGAIVSAIGCGPPVSLDEPGDATSPGTNADGFGPTSTSGASNGDSAQPTDGPDDGSAKLDVQDTRRDLPDEPLPPGICPPDCQFELSLAWSSDGPFSPDPLDPEDQVLVAAHSDGSVTVAEERQGSIEVAQLEPLFGRESWRMPLSLPCDPCRLGGLDLHPSGDALLSGYGIDGTGSRIAFVARVELAGPSMTWSTATPLASGTDVIPRAGNPIVLDDGRIAQLALEGTATDGVERLSLLTYDPRSGERSSSDEIATTMATGDATLPLAAPNVDASIAASQPSWDDAEPVADLLWTSVVGDGVIEQVPVPAPILALGSATEGQTLALGQTMAEGRSTLVLHYGLANDPTLWSTTHVQITDSAPAPALAVSPLGHAYIATRTASGPPGRETQTGVELTRWSDIGEPSWQVTLPLQTDYVERPLSLRLIGDDILVLGAYVGGRRYVEQRASNCVCD